MTESRGWSKENFHVLQSENGSATSSAFRPSLSQGKKNCSRKTTKRKKPKREQGPEGMLEGGLKAAVGMAEGGLKVPMPPLHLREVLTESRAAI